MSISNIQYTRSFTVLDGYGKSQNVAAYTFNTDGHKGHYECDIGVFHNIKPKSTEAIKLVHEALTTMLTRTKKDSMKWKDHNS